MLGIKAGESFENYDKQTIFLATSPTTTGPRIRVDDGYGAVSLGLHCVTDLQCRASDPSSRCIEGVCDCIIKSNGTSGCSARNRGCITGTFQVCFVIIVVKILL